MTWQHKGQPTWFSLCGFTFGRCPLPTCRTLQAQTQRAQVAVNRFAKEKVCELAAQLGGGRVVYLDFFGNDWAAGFLGDLSYTRAWNCQSGLKLMGAVRACLWFLLYSDSAQTCFFHKRIKRSFQQLLLNIFLFERSLWKLLCDWFYCLNNLRRSFWKQLWQEVVLM